MRSQSLALGTQQVLNRCYLLSCSAFLRSLIHLVAEMEAGRMGSPGSPSSHMTRSISQTLCHLLSLTEWNALGKLKPGLVSDSASEMRTLLPEATLRNVSI